MMIVAGAVVWVLRGESAVMRKSRLVQLGMTVEEAAGVMEIPIGQIGSRTGWLFQGPLSLRAFGLQIQNAIGWSTPLLACPDEVEIFFDANGRVCRIKRGREIVEVPMR